MHTYMHAYIHTYMHNCMQAPDDAIARLSIFPSVVSLSLSLSLTLSLSLSLSVSVSVCVCGLQTPNDDIGDDPPEALRILVMQGAIKVPHIRHIFGHIRYVRLIKDMAYGYARIPRRAP